MASKSLIGPSMRDVSCDSGVSIPCIVLNELFYRLFLLRLIAQIFTQSYVHELFCQFISWTNWVNSGKFMDNCWVSCHVMAEMKKSLRRPHNY